MSTGREARALKAVVFDVDGVLIDSIGIILDAYRKTAEMLGLRIPSEQEVMRLMGGPLMKIVEALWPNANAKLYVKEFRNLFMDKDLMVPEIEGSVDAVKKIRESGFRIGVVSGKIQFFIEKHLREAGFNINWFEAVGSFEATKKHKPDPDPLLYVIDKLKAKPEEAIYVGDAVFDYECARNAEVEFVAVLTGSLSREELEKLGVRNIIGSVAELPDLLRQCFSLN
ncbi:MAG: HAD family hydrolase [Candidatus Bathyarchaeota archaeon]|nr:HAD family hydrolase [Candidatus Bathyarchaeota archaeon]